MGGIQSLAENVLETHQNSALRESHPAEVLHIMSFGFVYVLLIQ